MRLLKRDDLGNISFTEDLTEDNVPKYAILSHTWGPTADEVTFEDITSGTGISKPGYEKIRLCIRQTEHDGLEYFWVDTCCIDKKNNTELSRAIISMFRWYSKAEKCYVFLSDVSGPSLESENEQASKSWEQSFRTSRWFERGWTLQELLAPRLLEFYSRGGHKLGTKDSLRQTISEITRIPTDALDGKPLADFSIQERLAWQESRKTKEEEDMVYSLFGIFDVSMPVLYGEGRIKAQARLQKELYDELGSEYHGRKPTQNLPFLRDPDFAHRTELSDIHEKLSRPGTHIALVGLGGVGKSQLAIEYCYRLQDQSPDIWVFWIHASSAARFDQDIQKLADDVKIPGRQDKNADIYNLVYSWLSDNRRSWFIVLDNADDADYLFQPPPASSGQHSLKLRIAYLSTCTHGSILTTTRRRTVASRLVDDRCVIPIQPERDHGIELLKIRLGQPDQAEDIEELAAALEYMPLAIVQAAAYIKKRTPRCSIQEYLVKLEKSDRSKSNLLKTETEEVRRDRLEARNSILLTWQISFEHIHGLRQSAADLLSLMSFFDHQGIPETLVRPDVEQTNMSTVKDDTSNSSENSGDEAFEHDLDVLRDFSFISFIKDRATFQMHRLVQLAAQVWLKEKGQYHHWGMESLRKLHHAYPEPDYEQWKECLILQPHALLVSNMKINERDAQLLQAHILYKLGCFVDTQGSYAEAEAMVMRSMHLFARILGPVDLYTCRSTWLLAKTHHRQGKWTQAEELFKKAVDIYKTVLGPEDARVSICLSSLAETYMDQGRWREAEDLVLRVSDTIKTMLGPEHPETLRSMSNLALVYRHQARWKEAEELNEKVVETFTTVLGADRPETLSSMRNLAVIYSEQERWREAEELNLKLIQKDSIVFGAEHPETVTCMGNLSMVYLHQGRWKEAEELALKVIKTQSTVLGADHPDTLPRLNDLAGIYIQQGRLKEAEELYVQITETYIPVLGVEHPKTITSMGNLATVYSQQERWREAEELKLRVLQTSRKVLGAEHPRTIQDLEDLASLYLFQERWKEAEEVGLQVIETRVTVLGPEHPRTLTSMNNLAMTYFCQGRTSEAQELFESCLEARTRIWGATHPITQMTQRTLNVVNEHMGKPGVEELPKPRIGLSQIFPSSEVPSPLTTI